MDKGLVYYTDNRCEERILIACRRQLERCMEKYGFPVISVSHWPITFGKNFVMELPRSPLSIYKQMVRGMEECETDVIFLIEHDVLYHPSHFDFTPPGENRFCYNMNRWFISSTEGKAITYYGSEDSFLSGYRELLLKHYRKAIEVTEKFGFRSSLGFNPPRGVPVEDYCGKAKRYISKYPNIHIKHDNNYTKHRMDKSEFRVERNCRNWQEADEVPGWGKVKGRFDAFLNEVGREWT